MSFKNHPILLLSIALLLFCASPATCIDIEVGLITSPQQIKLGSNQKATLINTLTKKEISKTNKNETLIIKNIDGLISISLNKADNKLGSFTGPITFIPENKTSLVHYNNKWYRGGFVILTNKDKSNITIVNKVDLEDYLLSVVPSEIPNKWDSEALKAQAVAARSYSIGYLNRRRSKGYDLESTVEDQVYLGTSAEKKTTSDAVKETSGLILLDKNNKPFIALYHSSAGGYTDSIENIWDKEPSEHLKPQPDYDDNSPHFKWERTHSLAEISKLLSSLDLGTVEKIKPLSRSFSERIMWIEVTGTKNKVKMRGDEFRRSLKLPSSKFNLKIEDDQVKFAGRGYGHGLGLSQWGSKALAEQGFTYKDILAHYYPGTKLVKWESKTNIVEYKE